MLAQKQPCPAPAGRIRSSWSTASGHRRGPAHCRAATLQAPTKQPDLAQQLLDARKQAVALFDAIEEQGIFQPGRSEEECNADIFNLAAQRFGTRKHWHQRLVRVGANTVKVYSDNEDVPNLTLAQDDIAFVDLGPVFSNIEADFARCWVLGEDKEKLALQAALPEVFEACRLHYQQHPDQTGEEFYRFVSRAAAPPHAPDLRQLCRECEARGYSYGNPGFCGHLVGSFDHSTILRKDSEDYAGPGVHKPMSAPGKNGLPRHWILEIHLIHPSGAYGGFAEDLLAGPGLLSS